MSAYYNENDAFAAEWLRQLIAKGHVAPGEVDTRSIEDVTPDDLRGFQQHHFFAGIGVWSRALRDAGWPDDRMVWTGSCPCQPFSAAGKGGGFADERHLWPAWHWLIEQHRPPVVFGEQVASKPGLGWFDLVSSDLEGSGYAVGAADLGAASVGAPHIRQRLWFVAIPDKRRYITEDQALCTGRPSTVSGGDMVNAAGEQEGLSRRTWEPGSTVADDDDAGLEGRQFEVVPECADQQPFGPGGYAGPLQRPVAVPDGRDARTEWQQRSGEYGQQSANSRTGYAGPLQHPEGDGRIERRSESERGSPAGFWRAADWIECRDGKRRPVEPATFPLAHGYPSRVGRLRAYGNAICPQVASAFIRASIDALAGT